MSSSINSLLISCVICVSQCILWDSPCFNDCEDADPPISLRPQLNDSCTLQGYVHFRLENACVLTERVAILPISTLTVAPVLSPSGNFDINACSLNKRGAETVFNVDNSHNEFL